MYAKIRLAGRTGEPQIAAITVAILVAVHSVTAWRFPTSYAEK